jgi:photosystem II stability/assembly factor-like uncharacterized protein
VKRFSFIILLAVSITAASAQQSATQQPSRTQRRAQPTTPAATPSEQQPANAQQQRPNQPEGQRAPAPPEPSRAEQAPAETAEERAWRGLTWRQIGPFRGGRVLAVAGDVQHPNTYYFGSVAGGVWKTTDAGVTWLPVFDKVRGVSSIGSIAVADSDPNVIYVGSGEACIRGNIVAGNGVYKSIDAGKTWQHIGLRDTQTIGRVIVHPRNPDLVFVAALGHVYGTNTERGVFRSADGGKTWQKVLYKDDKTGAIDITFDPSNPNTMFAALWEAHRAPWEMVSGGPGSGLYKSTDGGLTWHQLTGNGLPRAVLGRIGVSVSGASPNRVYAIVEAENGGVFRSDDGGDNWRLMNSERNLRQRAWYYTHIFADPKSLDTVYVLNTSMYRSNDGGRTFTPLPAPHGDHHGLWIDPNNPQRMINSNDGGANVSMNGGLSWSAQDNQPTAQFYHVVADNRAPYWIYGAQQDNSTVGIVTKSDSGGIDRGDWYDVGGGESGYIAPDPRDPEIIYAGSYGGLLTRLNRHTGQTQLVNPYPRNPMGHAAADLKYRFQWTYPIVISPHDPNTIYAAANVLFKSTDNGMSWTTISGDLTKNDRTKQAASGGPITKDNTSVEYYDTIFSLAESPKQAGVLWVGTDDGLIQLTRDGGAHWQDVTPKEMPAWGRVNMVEASPHDAGAAYIAVEKHELDDWTPYAFKTSDYGKTWTKITNGLPAGALLHAVREDTVRKGLLFAGTETGIYVSFDGGGTWQNSVQRNLPTTPVHDLIVKNDDVVAATHGRAFWILDDIAVLRQYNAGNADGAVLYKPTPAERARGGGFEIPSGRAVGQNPPAGALVYYFLKNAPAGPQGGTTTGAQAGAASMAQNAPAQEGSSAGQAGQGAARRGEEITLEIADSAGKLVRKFSNLPRPDEAAAEDQETPAAFRRGAPPNRLPAQQGLNRFVWNLRYEDAARVPNSPLWAGNISGPLVMPGMYQLKLTSGGKSYTAPLEVRLDPRVKVAAADIQKQFDLRWQIYQQLDAAHKAVNQIRNVRRQAQDMQRRTAGSPSAQAVADAAKKLDARMTPIEEAIIQTKSRSSQDPLNFPIRLNNELAALAGEVESADTAPTKQDYEVFEHLKRELEPQLTAWKQVLTTDVPAFNDLVKQQNIPAVNPDLQPPAQGAASPQ